MKSFIIKNITGLGFFIIVGWLASCQKQIGEDTDIAGEVFNLQLNFTPVVDAAPLIFNTPYKNSFQETYSVTAFKFYICNIDLINTDENIINHISRDYFLIDASDPTTTVISFKAAPHKYDYISFTIGVDSARNVSGAQTGALDPARGMFWTWNSGYIMAKLEGSSLLSNQPNNKIEYHIGGFKEPDNTIKKVTLAFPDSKAVEFLPGSTGSITVSANVNAWFNNPNDLRIASIPVCATPGELAKKFAENYSKMFKLNGIVTN